MNKVKMITVRRHPFGAGFRERDDEYEADENEAKILTALGWAREAGAAAPKKVAKKATKKVAKQTYQTRDMKAKD